jgi:hypothetical protein
MLKIFVCKKYGVLNESIVKDKFSLFEYLLSDSYA